VSEPTIFTIIISCDWVSYQLSMQLILSFHWNELYHETIICISVYMHTYTYIHITDWSAKVQVRLLLNINRIRSLCCLKYYTPICVIKSYSMTTLKNKLILHGWLLAMQVKTMHYSYSLVYICSYIELSSNSHLWLHF